MNSECIGVWGNKATCTLSVKIALFGTLLVVMMATRSVVIAPRSAVCCSNPLVDRSFVIALIVQLPLHGICQNFKSLSEQFKVCLRLCLLGRTLSGLFVRVKVESSTPVPDCANPVSQHTNSNMSEGWDARCFDFSF